MGLFNTFVSKLQYFLLNMRTYFFNIFRKSNTIFFDLSEPISSETPVFPGDPSFKVDQIQDINKGSTFNLCYLHIGNHMGTHIDFPAHVISEGKTSSDYALTQLIGPGLIVELPAEEKVIGKDFIKKQNIKQNDIVFFKTSNSKLPRNELSTTFVTFNKNAAEELVKKKVKVVGIDYFSVDSLDEEKLPIHKTFLEHDVLIVENLNLRNVPAGCYKEICIIPPNIPGMDGLPARVFARQ